MQLQEVSQEMLATYVGGEIVLGNDDECINTLLLAKVTDIKVVGTSVSVSFTCTGWTRGTLEDTATCEWKELSGNGAVLLGSGVALEDNGHAHFSPSAKGTIADLTPPLSSRHLQAA